MELSWPDCYRIPLSVNFNVDLPRRPGCIQHPTRTDLSCSWGRTRFKTNYFFRARDCEMILANESTRTFSACLLNCSRRKFVSSEGSFSAFLVGLYWESRGLNLVASITASQEAPLTFLTLSSTKRTPKPMLRRTAFSNLKLNLTLLTISDLLVKKKRGNRKRVDVVHFKQQLWDEPSWRSLRPSKWKMEKKSYHLRVLISPIFLFIATTHCFQLWSRGPALSSTERRMVSTRSWSRAVDGSWTLHLANRPKTFMLFSNSDWWKMCVMRRVAKFGIERELSKIASIASWVKSPGLMFGAAVFFLDDLVAGRGGMLDLGMSESRAFFNSFPAAWPAIDGLLLGRLGLDVRRHSTGASIFSLKHTE